MIKEKRLKYIVFCLLNMTGIFAFVGQVAAQAIVGDTHSGYSVAAYDLPSSHDDMNYYGRRGRESGKLLKKVLPALKAIISLNNLCGVMKWIITRK